LDQCAPVLEEALGVQVVRYENEERMSREMARSYLCNEDNGAYLYDRFRRETAGGSASVLWGLFDGGGGAEILNSVTTFRRWQRTECRRSVEEASLEELRQFFMTTDDRRASVYAWTECVTRVTACHVASDPSPEGLAAVVDDPEASPITVHLRWCGTVGDVGLFEATVVSIRTDGLSCEIDLEPDDEMPVGDTIALCRRIDENRDGLLGVTIEVAIPGGGSRRYAAVAVVPGFEPEPPCAEEEFFHDPDRDGFATADAVTKWACEEDLDPAEREIWVRRRPDSNLSVDCCEGDTNARPGQTGYFATPTKCGGYDYDCDGEVTEKWTENAVCEELHRTERCSDSTIVREGWAWASEAPACGETEQFATEGSRCRGFHDWCFPAEYAAAAQRCR